MRGLEGHSDALGRFSATFLDVAWESAYRDSAILRDRRRLLLILVVATLVPTLNIVAELRAWLVDAAPVKPILWLRLVAFAVGSGLTLHVYSARAPKIDVIATLFSIWAYANCFYLLAYHPHYQVSGQVTALGMAIATYLFAPLTFRRAVAIASIGGAVTWVAWAAWREPAPSFGDVYRFSLWAIALHVLAAAACHERESNRRKMFSEAVNLQESVRREQEAASRQRQFMSMIAHELRNPLAIIRGQAQVARAEAVRDVVVPVSRYEAIERSIVRIERLFNQWLQIDKFEASDFAPRFTQLSFQDWYAEFQSRIDAGTRVSFMDQGVGDCHFRADPTLLDVALGNLIENALKYSRDPAPVRVQASREVGQLVLSVEDRGSGIGPGDQACIFDKYVRGSNVQGERGVGLGLFLVRHISNLHGGRVELKSELGQGSRFSIILPV